MATWHETSQLLDFLARDGLRPGDRLPAIPDLAQELGISTGKLREQLEVVRQLGLVEVRPKTGIRMLPYTFSPAVRTSLMFALATDPRSFEAFGELRSHVEACFWREAAQLLQPEDKEHLQHLVQQAWSRLHGNPIQIPHEEHRDLHLTVFSRMDNTFVKGLIEAYWEAYEAVGLNVYEEFSYLKTVWTFHERMVDAIVAGDYEAGYQAFVEHVDLIRERTNASPADRGGSATRP